MKAFCVLGSPRQGGNTAKVLGWIEDELRLGDYAVVRLNLGNGVLAPCRECYACKKVSGAPGCGQDDRGNSIFLEMMTSDLIVLASPIFCWGVSAQMKALLDRAFCLLKEDEQLLLAGKRMALVATGAGAIKDNLDLLVPPYQAFAQYFKCKDIGTLLIPGCTTPDKLNGDVEKRARKFGRSLA